MQTKLGQGISKLTPFYRRITSV